MRYGWQIKMKLAETILIPFAEYFKIHFCSQKKICLPQKGISSLPTVWINFPPERVV